MAKPKYFNVIDMINRHSIGRLRRAKPDTLVLAYKFSKPNGSSTNRPTTKPVLKCRSGALLRVSRPDKDAKHDCGAGVNVATLEWCNNHSRWSIDVDQKTGNMRKGLLWQVAFHRRDVACIPHRADGKIRLYRCRVVRRVVSFNNLDYKHFELWGVL